MFQRLGCYSQTFLAAPAMPFWHNGQKPDSQSPSLCCLAGWLLFFCNVLLPQLPASS